MQNRQEILLSTISEKDQAIAELECDRSASVANKAKIQRLVAEKDNLYGQLQELNQKRMKIANEFMAAKENKDRVRALSLLDQVSMAAAHDEDGIYG